MHVVWTPKRNPNVVHNVDRMTAGAFSLESDTCCELRGNIHSGLKTSSCEHETTNAVASQSVSHCASRREGLKQCDNATVSHITMSADIHEMVHSMQCFGQGPQSVYLLHACRLVPEVAFESRHLHVAGPGAGALRRASETLS